MHSKAVTWDPTQRDMSQLKVVAMSKMARRSNTTAPEMARQLTMKDEYGGIAKLVLPHNYKNVIRDRAATHSPEHDLGPVPNHASILPVAAELVQRQ